MKKLFVAYIALMILSGSGCVKEQTPNNNQLNATDTSNKVTNIEKIETEDAANLVIKEPPDDVLLQFRKEEYTNISKEMGFHVYFPTYLPSGYSLNDLRVSYKNGLIAQGKMITVYVPKRTEYKGRATESFIQAPFYLNQYQAAGNDDYYEYYIEVTKAKINEVKINEQITGKVGRFETAEGERIFIFFTTNDKTKIWLESEILQFETLLKIAESIK